MKLTQRLRELVISEDIIDFEYNQQVGEGESGLSDELTITFNSGEELTLTTLCSGCLENSYLDLVE